MGLFSRDETIYVASVIYPLGPEPDEIPDLVQSAVIASGMLGQSRSRAINRAIFDGNGVKLSQAYYYAAHKYYAGLPVGYPTLRADKDDPLLELLCTEYLKRIYIPTYTTVDVKSLTVEYADNFQTVLRQQIETKYNYDFYEGAVHTAVFGIPVDSTLVYARLASDDLLHPDELGWRLTFTKPDTTTVTFDEWYAESVFAGQDVRENRIFIGVSFDGGPAKSLKFSYGDADPRLNLFLRSLVTKQSGTFPGIVLKKPKQLYLNTDGFSGTPYQQSPSYTTSKRYADRMGINIDDVIDLIKDNANERKIDYAFIQPGTKINSPNTPAHEYHFNYFYRLFALNPNNKPTFDAWVTKNAYTGGDSFTSVNKAQNCPAQSFRILDPDDTKHSIQMEIAWRYMTYEVKTGTLAKPYMVECGAQEFVRAKYFAGRAHYIIEYDITKFYLRKRLTSTTYAELMVCGLWHENYVFKGEKVQSGVWDAFNDPEGDFGTGFLIPLEFEIFVGLSARERLQLSQEAIHVVFNCYKVVKEKWYETDLFKFVIYVITMVITAYSFGTLGPALRGLYAGVSGSVGAILGPTASLTVIAAVAYVITAIIAVAIYVGVTFVAKEAGEWAAEQWGPAWGAIVQIAVAIVLSMGVVKGVNGLTNTPTPPVGLVQSAVNATSFILTGLSTYTEFAMQEFQETQTKWNDYITSPDNPAKLLEEQMAKMFPDMTLIEEAWFMPRETMDEFLGRTLTLVDGLTYRLTLPISNLTELTLTPRLL